MTAELGTSTNPRDFVPGDPTGIRDDAGAWTAVADRLDDVVGKLSKIEADGWSGGAADKFLEMRARHKKRWQLLATAYREGAATIGTYADELAGAQAKAQIAIDLWETGESARAQWEKKRSATGSTTARLLVDTDPGSGDREEARQIMAQAQQTANAEAQVAQDILANHATKLDALSTMLFTPLDMTVAPSVTLSGGVLAMLSRLTTAELLTLIRADPALLTRLRPEEAAEWWQSFGGSFDAQGDYVPSLLQTALILAAPAVIGNLNGLPYGARDKANRIWLEQQLEEARVAAEHPPKVSATPGAELVRVAALENILATLNVQGENGGRYLIGLTDDVPPLAQISVGNLDLAKNATYLIPGMNTFTTDMLGWTRAAQNIHDELTLLDKAGTYAVVAWVGYEAPPIPVVGAPDLGVFRGEYASNGADRLAADLGGYNAATAGQGTTLNVLAHSYGTTTSATTLAEGDYGISSYVMVGSAGIEHAVGGAAGINAEHVYAAQAGNTFPWLDGDGYAQSGRDLSMRDNPVDDSFGSIVMGADGEPGNAGLHATTAHDAISGENNGYDTEDSAYGYLEPGSESLTNVAHALLGEPGLITKDQPQVYDPYDPAIPGSPYRGWAGELTPRSHK